MVMMRLSSEYTHNYMHNIYKLEKSRRYLHADDVEKWLRVYFSTYRHFDNKISIVQSKIYIVPHSRLYGRQVNNDRMNKKWVNKYYSTPIAMNLSCTNTFDIYCLVLEFSAHY